jgi:hypothetical protein
VNFYVTFVGQYSCNIYEKRFLFTTFALDFDLNSKIFLNKMVHTIHHKPSPIIFPEEKCSLSLSLFRTLQTRALVAEPRYFVLTAGQATDEAYTIHFQTKSD